MRLIHHYSSKCHSLPIILLSRGLQALALTRKRIRSHTNADQKALHEHADPQERLKALREQGRRDWESEVQSAGQVRRFWLQTAPADPDHPYLADKQLLSHNLLQLRGGLLMPLFFEGKLVNLEYIYPDGDKQRLSGGRIEGVAGLIGRPKDAEHVLVPEDWSSAAGLYEVMGFSFVIALGFWNLESVARHLRQRFPKAEVTICCNDYHRMPAYGLPNMDRVEDHCFALVIDAELKMPSFCESCESCTSFDDVRLCQLGGGHGE